MKWHVATTLDRFVGQSLLEFTQRTDVLLATKHQRRVTLVSRFFESAVNNLNTIQIITRNLSLFVNEQISLAFDIFVNEFIKKSIEKLLILLLIKI